MDCFASLAMKVSGIEHKSAISRRDASEVCINVAPKNKEGAGDAGCALHPRSRVQLCEKLRTRAYRFSGNTPASPAQWLYGLWRDLPGDEFVFVTVAAGLRPRRSGWIISATGSLTSATDAGTTRSCRTQPDFAKRSAGIYSP